MEIQREQHPYIRAYMAGLTVPAVFLMAIMLLYVLARLIWELPFPVERIIAFPMAIIPNAWGLWNVLYFALHWDRRLSLGWYGALLPCLLMPVGWQLAKTVGLEIAPVFLLINLTCVAALYYVVWRFLVGALNRIVGMEAPQLTKAALR